MIFVLKITHRIKVYGFTIKKYHNNTNNIKQHNDIILINKDNIKYKCDKCNKSYKHQQSKSRHQIECKIESLFEIKYYKCKKCNKKYKHKQRY